MQGTRTLIVSFQNARYISSSNIYLNNSREGRFIKKIIHGTRKMKKRWYDESSNLSAININPANKSPSIHTMRRMAIRNKLFMEHITDQISMGEVSDIISRNIEITHIKITPDFKCVNVFWAYNNPNASSLVTEEELQRCAKIIRHELSQLRVIGVVPPIQFVKNKQFFIEKEVEEKLAIIAREKDIEESSLYPEEIQLATSHSAINQTLQEPVSNKDSKMDEPHIQLPVMRHDVLGLDHHKIMSQITASLSKSRKGAERRMQNTNAHTDGSCNLISQKVTDFLTQKEQQQLFSDFLVKQRIEKKRKRYMKQLHEQELKNIEENEEEEGEQEEGIEFDYENEYNIDKYNDEFGNKT